MFEQGEDNKKKVAETMLSNLMKAIEKGKVSAIHLAVKLHSEDTDDYGEETEEVEEVNNNKGELCPECGKEKDKCKCA